MYDDYSYLIHSAKGSTWSKGDHKYISKIKKNGRWRYIYKLVKAASDETTRNRMKNDMDPEQISTNNGKYKYYSGRLKDQALKDSGKANSFSNPQGNKYTKLDGNKYFDQTGFSNKISYDDQQKTWDNYEYQGDKLVYKPKNKK